MTRSKLLALLVATACVALCMVPGLAFAKGNTASNLAATTLEADAGDKYALEDDGETTDEDPAPSGTYLLTSGSGAKKAITVSAKKASVASMKSSNEAQRLYLHAEGPNTVSIQSVSTGSFLKAKGAKVVCASFASGDDSFLWTVTKKGRGYIFTNVFTGKKLTFNGKNLVGGSSATVWKLKESRLVDDGNYVVVNGAKKMAMSVKGSDFEEGTRIIVSKETGYLNQAFSFERVEGDVYVVRSVLSNRAIGVETATEGATAQVGAMKPSKREQWIVGLSKAGGLKLVNVASGFVLNAEGNGGNRKYVDTEAAANNKNQSWSLTKSNLKYNKAVKRAANIIEDRKSKTAYYVTVDRTAHWLTVFKGDQGQWEPLRAWIVSIGTSGWPTPVGNFKIGWKGKSFGEDHGYSVYYYTNFAVIGQYDYHFHSIKYYPYTMKVQDGRLGRNISGGCVRMSLENAKWLQKTVKRNTAVKIYN